MGEENRYKALVKRTILDPAHFIKATFSGRRRGYELAWRRVTVRPVVIRGERHLQCSHLDETQDITKNYAGEEAAEKVASLLELPFSQIHVQTTEVDLQVQISRKGRARIHRYRVEELRLLPAMTHDHQKARLLDEDVPDPFLQALGIMTEEGEVRANRRDKFVQINEFLRLIVETRELDALDHSPLTLVDCGCGSADLTFAVYHYLNYVLERPARLTGVDVKRALLRERAALAERLGWEGLSFVASRIIDFEPAIAPDLVLALHACDTATDEALAQAVAWGSRMIFSVPCCHHDLQAQMKGPAMPAVFQPVLRQGILKERLGDILTDTFRAQLLRMLGYRTDVVEFVSSEHTDKNLMIRAVKFADPGDAQMVREYERLKSYWDVQPFMERLLADALPDLPFFKVKR